MAYLIYIIKWTLSLTLLYSLYGLFLRRESFHRVNRGVLLFILTASMLLPLCNLTLVEDNVVAKGASRVQRVIRQNVPTAEPSSAPKEILTSEPQREVQPQAEPQPESPSLPDSQPQPVSVGWQDVLTWLYLIGLAFCLLRYVMSLAWLISLIARGKRKDSPEVDHWMHIIVHDRVEAPMSWMRWILVNSRDAQEPCLLMHEAIHLRKRHSLDLLLAELTARLQWFNPLAWMLCTDLRAIHEYEVDREVVNRGIERKDYEMMLIDRATQVRISPVTHGLKGSKVKERLKRLHDRPSGRWAWMKVLYLLPLLAVAVLLLARYVMSPAERAQLSSMLFDQNVQRWEKEDRMYSSSNEMAFGGAVGKPGDTIFYYYSDPGPFHLTQQLLAKVRYAEMTGDGSQARVASYEFDALAPEGHGPGLGDELIMIIYGGDKGDMEGYFYGNSSEFMRTEDLLHGYFVLPMWGIRDKDEHLYFSLDATGRNFLNAPVSPRYTSHYDALCRDSYEPWHTRQNIGGYGQKGVPEPIRHYKGKYSGPSDEWPDSILISNETLPYQDKKYHCFRRISRGEAFKYRKELMQKEFRKANAYSSRTLGQAEVVVETRKGKAYRLFEADGDNYVCYLQDYFLLPKDQGELKYYSSRHATGFVRAKVDGRVPVYTGASANSRILTYIEKGTDEVPEYYPNLGCTDEAWCKIEVGGTTEQEDVVGYVNAHNVVWDPLGI